MVRVLVIIVVAIALALPQAGSFLVVDRPQSSDAGVVLQGDYSDFRLNRGIELLRAGTVRQLFLDADDRFPMYGKTPAQMAAAYIQTLPPELASRVHVCPVPPGSTLTEAGDVGRCLASTGVKRLLLVTSDYHTRRSLSIFRAALPRYEWSAAAVRDPGIFGEKYWQRRTWLKTAWLEWQKTLYWHLVERFKVRPGR